MVPERLSAIALAGVRVQVEFGSSVHEGLILERCESSPNAGKLKNLLGVLSIHPVATPETIELFRLVARRWAGAPYDIIRSAIPPRVASVDKEEFLKPAEPEEKPLLNTSAQVIPKALLSRWVRAFWSMPACQRSSQILAALVISRAEFGQVLLVVPDERNLLAVERELLHLVSADRIARLDGHNSRSDRYRDFLRVTKGVANIAIGLRGAIFTPLSEEATIIVIGESSQLLYEPRTPGWNVRDVALMRVTQSEVNLIFAGFSPSLEIGRLIDMGWLSMVSSQQRRSVIAAPQMQGELLPSKAFDVVRKALKDGPILFLVPRKGYGNAVLCKKCRNVATCNCGGRLQQSGAGRSPQCVLCLADFPLWRCNWCQSDEIYIAARGIDRFVEEIGRSFPNVAVINSSGEHIVDSISRQSALVVATPGSEPDVEGGYGAVMLLEGIRFFGHSELRSAERAREQFFQSASLVSANGEFFSNRSHASDCGRSYRWNPAPMVRKELQERAEVALPPYYRFITIN